MDIVSCAFTTPLFVHANAENENELSTGGTECFDSAKICGHWGPFSLLMTADVSPLAI